MPIFIGILDSNWRYVIDAGVGVGVGVGFSVDVGSEVSVGDAVGTGMFGDSVGVETGVGSVTVALSTGLRLLLLLMATESAVMSMSTLVVAPSLISNLTIMSILSEGTFKTVVLPSVNVAVASLTCKRIFE